MVADDVPLRFLGRAFGNATELGWRQWGRDFTGEGTDLPWGGPMNVVFSVLVVVYLPCVYAGKAYMEKRDAYDLKYPLFVWNMTASAFSGIGMYYLGSGVAMEVWELGLFGQEGQLCDIQRCWGNPAHPNPRFIGLPMLCGYLFNASKVSLLLWLLLLPVQWFLLWFLLWLLLLPLLLLTPPRPAHPRPPDARVDRHDVPGGAQEADRVPAPVPPRRHHALLLARHYLHAPVRHPCC